MVSRSDQIVPVSLSPMEDFTPRDLQFIAKYTEVGEEVVELHCISAPIVWSRQAPNMLQEFAGSQFRHLVHALCPALWGQELVKAGLLLALFGGCTPTAVSAGYLMPTRGDIHVLLCGDPGLGKSHLLQVLAPGG